MAKSQSSLGARLASYETLHDIARMLLSSASLDELLERLTTELKRLVPYDAITVYRVDGVRRLLVPMHSVDLWSDEIMDSPLELGRGITGWVVEHGKAEYVPAAHLDPRVNVVPGTPVDEPEALVSVPLVVRGEPIGALNAYRLGEQVGFSDEEFELVCRFGDLAALAIANTENREHLVKEAQTDWLTGLGNHRHFHELLRAEIERSHRYSRPLSLLIFDLDDFKVLNDVHGHQQGDVVLRRVTTAARDGLRASDVACRVGGEEFAIVLPETGKRAARAAADRLCQRVRDLPGPHRMTISCGVATFPLDAKAPADLLAAADAALYAAKARGKDRAASSTPAVRERRVRSAASGGQVESLAQLRLLTRLAGKLNRLHEVGEIARTIVEELRTIVRHDSARVYLIDEDGVTLEPLAFGGQILGTGSEVRANLRIRVGQGITGHAVQTGETVNLADARTSPFYRLVPETEDVDESIVAVPLAYDDRVIGAIVVSRLGREGFSPLSVRLLELLAAQAAVALESARLLDDQRRATDIAESLLQIATAASSGAGPEEIAGRVAAAARRLAHAEGAAVVVPEPASGRQRVLAHDGAEAVRSLALAAARVGPVAHEELVLVPTLELPARSVRALDAGTTAAIAPLGEGVLVVVAERFSQAACSRVTAVAGQAALALGSAASRARSA